MKSLKAHPYRVPNGKHLSRITRADEVETKRGPVFAHRGDRGEPGLVCRWLLRHEVAQTRSIRRVAISSRLRNDYRAENRGWHGHRSFGNA